MSEVLNTNYTYVRSVGSVPLLMSTVSKVFGKKLENFDFDSATNTITISFVEPLSTGDKDALNTLMNIYTEFPTLTSNDVVAKKYIRSVKTLDQNLTTTLNAVDEITFPSTSYLDRFYYQTDEKGRFIFIQRPGIYLVIAKVGAKLQPGNVAGTNSVLQWAFSNDELRTSVAYFPIMNTNAYTSHTNTNNMVDSTTICCIFTVTSLTGTNIRLTSKRIVGTTPLVVDNDQCNFNILSIPGASFYEGNMTVALTLNPLTYSPINLGSDRIIQFPFSHAVGQPNITVTQDGVVKVLVKATFNKTAGIDGTNGIISAFLNGIEILDTGSITHLITAASLKTTVNFTALVKVAAGDVLSFKAKTLTGSFLQLPAAETGVILAYIQSNIFEKLNFTHYTNTRSTTSVGNSASALTFNTHKVSYPVSQTAVSSIFTVPTSGLYFISGGVTFNNIGLFPREVGVQITSSSDIGKSYYYVGGSLSVKQIPALGKVTVFTNAMANLPASSKISLTLTSNDSTDTISASNYTGISIVSLQDLEEDIVKYDRGFNVTTSKDEMIINAVKFVEKCRLVCYDLVSGVYKIEIYGTFVTTVQTQINFQMINCHVSTGNNTIMFNHTYTLAPGRYPFNTVDFQNIIEGDNIFILLFSSPSTTSYIVCENTIEILNVI